MNESESRREDNVTKSGGADPCDLRFFGFGGFFVLFYFFVCLFLK